MRRKIVRFDEALDQDDLDTDEARMILDLAPRELVKALGQNLLKSCDTDLEGLSQEEIRNIVGLYYQIQEFRKGMANQIRMAGKAPRGVSRYILSVFSALEESTKKFLDHWTDRDPTSARVKQFVGVGPMIVAGLAAHVDIERATTVSKLWRFAGLDPTLVWLPNHKRPYNARLKTLCWKASDSFKKNSNNPKSFFGRMYKERKALEVQRNDTGHYMDAAFKSLSNSKNKENVKEVFRSGKLPPFIVDRRAMRWVAKLFLSIWWEVRYENQFGKKPPVPYAAQELGHQDIIHPEDVERFERARQPKRTKREERATTAERTT